MFASSFQTTSSSNTAQHQHNETLSSSNSSGTVAGRPAGQLDIRRSPLRECMACRTPCQDLQNSCLSSLKSFNTAFCPAGLRTTWSIFIYVGLSWLMLVNLGSMLGYVGFNLCQLGLNMLQLGLNMVQLGLNLAQLVSNLAQLGPNLAQLSPTWLQHSPNIAQLSSNLAPQTLPKSIKNRSKKFMKFE